MLASLLLGAQAAGLEEVPGLDPGSGSFGYTALVAADLDRDGQVDFVADHRDAEGRPGLYGWSSAEGKPRTQADKALGSLRLATGDLSGDGLPELALALPEGRGLALVVDLATLQEPFSGWEAAGLERMRVVGSVDAGGLGTELLVADLQGSGNPQLVLGGPGIDGGGLYVLAFAEGSTTSQAKAIGGLRGSADLPVGAGEQAVLVGDQDGDGHPELAYSLARGLGWSPVAGLFPPLELSPGTESARVDGQPLALAAVGDLDGDGREDVALLTPERLLFLSLDGTELASFDVEPGAGSLLASADHLFVADGGELLSFSLDGLPELDQRFAVQGVTLGLAMARAGDLDGDGCEEVYTSAPEQGTLYRVYPPCGAGDSGDTGPDDSAPPDSAPDDSAPGDSLPGDTGLCEPEFGWSCAPGGGGSLAGLIFGLVGLLVGWRSRRQER